MEDLQKRSENDVQGDEFDGLDTLSEPLTEEPDMEALVSRMKEIEEEAQLIRRMQTDVERQMNISTSSSTSSQNSISWEEKVEVDSRSAYVGNVDYTATAEELETHFHGCGSMNRVTILTDKFSGHPKGYAYIEFADKESLQMALALDESLFHGRQIKVCAKRTNRPGLAPSRGRRGRGARVIVKYIYGASYRGTRGRHSRRRSSAYASTYA